MKALFQSRIASLGLLAAALVLGGAGAITARERSSLRKTRAQNDHLVLDLVGARWFEHEMDHGTAYSVPPSMIEGMPPEGVHRLNLELSVENGARAPKTFETRELSLHSTSGKIWPASGGEQETVRLGARQVVHLIVDFDVPDEDRGDLRVVWKRGATSIEMASIPHPKEHLRPAKQSWPDGFASLPAGDAERGAFVYSGKGACWSCHGRVQDRGSETVGPHLGDIGRESEQYLYESLIAPDRAIAPACPKGPCAKPSAMPPWGSILSKEEMADLVAYLRDQRSGG